jgi:hypothetical protein
VYDSTPEEALLEIVDEGFLRLDAEEEQINTSPKRKGEMRL